VAGGVEARRVQEFEKEMVVFLFVVNWKYFIYSKKCQA
jgi:hypothetical protein